MSNTKQVTKPEVYMRVIDRKRLAKIMVIQGVSQREMADLIGWRSHSYLGRIIRGQINTIDPDAAAVIAAKLGVGMDDLFMPRLSSQPAHVARRNSTNRSAA